MLGFPVFNESIMIGFIAYCFVIVALFFVRNGYLFEYEKESLTENPVNCLTSGLSTKSVDKSVFMLPNPVVSAA